MPVKPTKLLVFPVNFGTFNPSDSTTYYFSSNPRAPATTYDFRRSYLPISCKIIRAYVTMNCDNVNGTAENIVLSFRKNDTTDIAIATVGVSASHREFQNDNLNIDMLTTDHFVIKMATPAWVTNPDSMSANGFLLAIC